MSQQYIYIYSHSLLNRIPGSKYLGLMPGYTSEYTVNKTTYLLVVCCEKFGCHIETTLARDILSSFRKFKYWASTNIC